MAFIHEIKHIDGFRLQSNERHIDRRVLLLRSKAGFFIESPKLSSSIIGWGQQYLKEQSGSKNNLTQLSLRDIEATDLSAVAELSPNRSLYSQSVTNAFGIYPHFTGGKINCTNSSRSWRIGKLKRNENLELYSKLNQLAMASVSTEATVTTSNKTDI